MLFRTRMKHLAKTLSTKNRCFLLCPLMIIPCNYPPTQYAIIILRIIKIPFVPSENPNPNNKNLQLLWRWWTIQGPGGGEGSSQEMDAWLPGSKVHAFMLGRIIPPGEFTRTRTWRTTVPVYGWSGAEKNLVGRTGTGSFRKMVVIVGMVPLRINPHIHPLL